MNQGQFTANGWTAAMPDGWEDRSMITLIAASEAESGFASNIVVTRQRVEAQSDVEEFARAQAEMMRRELGAAGGALQILDERAIEIGGVRSYQRLQRFDAGGGQIVQQVQTFFSGAGEILVVTGTATVEAFDRAIPAFKQFVEAFRFD